MVWQFADDDDGDVVGGSADAAMSTLTLHQWCIHSSPSTVSFMALISPVDITFVHVWLSSSSPSLLL